MTELLSPKPEVKLLKALANFEDCVKAAAVCYNTTFPSDPVMKEKVIKTIGKQCFNGGHLTIFQHAIFHFQIKNVSRQIIWEFLHSQPFHNSSQESQRYVKLKSDAIYAFVPNFKSSEAKKIYEDAIKFGFDSYNEFNEYLLPKVMAEMRKITKFKNMDEEKLKKQAEKRTIEISRYFLPIATHAQLYHTINMTTIWRLARMRNQVSCPQEAGLLIDAILAEVKAFDPRFLDPEIIGELTPYKQEDALEYNKVKSAEKFDAFALKFDTENGERGARLIGYQQDAERILADSARIMIGVDSANLSDAETIHILMSPETNIYLMDNLRLYETVPLMRTLSMINYTFSKKLSHTADSQDQRHRTLPAARPLLVYQDTMEPDFIIPRLISGVGATEEYSQRMQKLWDYKNKIIELGEEAGNAIMLLPNAKAIRYVKNVPLLGYMHYANIRSCYNAQEEIYWLTQAEINEIKKVHPIIGEQIGKPQCRVRYERSIADGCENKMPCPEGSRHCGNLVWLGNCDRGLL